MHFPGHDVNGASPRRKAKVFKIRQRKILSLSLSSRGARFGRAITRHVARPTFPANQKNPHSADLIELSLTTRNVLPLSLITAYLSTTIRRSFFFFFFLLPFPFFLSFLLRSFGLPSRLFRRANTDLFETLLVHVCSFFVSFQGSRDRRSIEGLGI